MTVGVKIQLRKHSLITVNLFSLRVSFYALTLITCIHQTDKMNL